jgi:Alginate lyase
MTPLIENLGDWKRIKQRIAQNDPALQSARDEVLAFADESRNAPAQTVLEKWAKGAKHWPVGATRQDYVSIATYWWPDPSKSDGLPYIHRDGQLSPDTPLYDREVKDAVDERIACLCKSAVLFSEWANEDLRHVARHLDAFYTDPKSGMTPHARFAQFTPGLDNGRLVGLIDFSIRLPVICDRLKLVESMGLSLPNQSSEKFFEWCRAFLNWCLSDDVRPWHDKMYNNIGVYYDRMVCAIAMHLGDHESARVRLEAAFDRRFEPQIEPDGSQPHEMKRTRSFDYTVMNAAGLLALARLARHFGIDLISRRGSRGQSLEAAIDFAYQAASSDRPWPGQQITPIDWEKAARLFRAAGDLLPGRFSLSKLSHRLSLQQLDGDALLLASPLHPFR